MKLFNLLSIFVGFLSFFSFFAVFISLFVYKNITPFFAILFFLLLPIAFLFKMIRKKAHPNLNIIFIFVFCWLLAGIISSVTVPEALAQRLVYLSWLTKLTPSLIIIFLIAGVIFLAVLFATRKR